MLQNAWIIPALPLLAFVLIVFFSHRHRGLSAGLSIGAILAGFVFSVFILIKVLGDHGPHEFYFKWLDFGTWNLQIGLLIDPLTAVMLLVVTIVSACVQIYSLGYMHGDPLYSRYYAYLSLFTFSMLGLVLSNNFAMIFIFWELVGLTSYLLIGFWFEKKSASDAGKKAFITTRTGDLGFIVGILIVFAVCGTLNFNEVFDKVEQGVLAGGLLTAAAIFLFAGAVGKSAQFPLHVWLPDAMEGPTPVSALIHAATMVAAGVYLVARTMTIFAASESGAMVVAIIGISTSFMAASIGLVQNDIKRVLAYSTVSQLGYMIMALGLGGYNAAIGVDPANTGFMAGTYHLMTHAFFKALLFLAAGSVIHAVHTNDMQEMGGLGKKMKITAWTMFIASFSISGIFPLSGFWSKDEIVASTLHNPIFLVLTLAVAFMTAFYMFRLCFLTFTGKPRDQHKFDHAHESPKTMTVPLMVLAFLAVTAGWVGVPFQWIFGDGYSSFVYQHAPHHAHFHISWAIISLAVGLSGIGLAYLIYYKKKISADAIAAKFKPLYTLLFNKYYFDEIYDATIIQPCYAICDFWFWFDQNIIDGLVNGSAAVTVWTSEAKRWFDEHIVDGAVNGAGYMVRGTGSVLRFAQTGRLQNYALVIFAGVILIWFLR